MTPATLRFLDAIADSFNPLLAILALVAPLIRRPRTFRATALCYFSTGAAIAMVYVVRAIDAGQQIWASAGLDFSTHSAFAASLTTSIGAFRRRWLTFLVPLLIAYFCLLMILRYHGLLDILTSASLAAAVALLIERVSTRMGQGDDRESSSASHLTMKKATGLGWALFYPIFLAVVGAPAIPVLGVREAIGLALLALAWFAFGRLLVLVCLSAAFPKKASHRLVLAVGSAIVDVGGTIAGIWLDHRLIWSMLGAIVVTEAVFWRRVADAT